MNRRYTQQCNMSPYVYAVYWLSPASSAFLLARKCNWLAEKMLITCVMQHARLQKLQRFRRKMPFYSFLILCQSITDRKRPVSVVNKLRYFFLRSFAVFIGRSQQNRNRTANEPQPNRNWTAYAPQPNLNRTALEPRPNRNAVLGYFWTVLYKCYLKLYVQYVFKLLPIRHIIY